MAFANLQIDLNANLQNLQGQLDRAQALSDNAFAKIQRSADGAGQSIGDAANAADFGPLSKSAQAASDSIDGIKTASAGAGSAVDGLTAKVGQLLDQISADAKERADQVGTGTKIAVAAGVAAIGYGLVKIGEFAAAAAFRFASAAVDVAEFGAGLVTGENLQSKYIDGLIKADEKVRALQVSLGITATSASALALALDRIGVPKDDYTSVYTSTETAVRKLIAAQDQLYAKARDARDSGDPDAIKASEEALNKNTSAFQRLGVAVTDESGKTLSYQQIIQNASKVLDTYTAGYDRNAAAAELGLGSAEKVANAAKVNAASFAEAAKRQQDYYLVIGPGAQAAIDEYQQAMRIFRSESDLTAEGVKRAIADATLPILTELADFLKDGFPAVVDVVRGALTGIVAVFETFELSAKALYEITSFSFDSMEISVSSSLGAIQKALHFDFTGARKEVEEGARAIEERFEQLLTNTSSNLAKAVRAIDLAAGKDSATTPVQNEKPAGGRPYTPPPADGGKDDKKSAATPNVDLAKKQLEQQLKALDLFIGDEKELLTSRDDFLSQYYQDGNVAIADYFTFRANAQAEYTAKTKAAYSEEIADLEAYIAKTKANGNLSDDQSAARVTDAQTKILEVRNKLRKVESDASQETLKDWFAQRRAVEQYGDQLASLAAQIKSFSGDSAGAAAINFDAQNRELQRRLQATLRSDNTSPDDRKGAAQGLTDLAQLREQAITTAKLNDLTSARSVILGDLANVQDRIDLAVSRGSKSELQGLADQSAANAARLDSLQKIAEAYDRIAESSNNLQDKVNADAAHVALEKLRSQTNLVADAFDDAGKSVTENFLDKLTDGTTKPRDALKALFHDIDSRLLKLGNDAIGNALFGKDGGLLSSLGKSVQSFFSPSAGSGSLSGAAVQASKDAISTAGGATTGVGDAASSAEAGASFSTAVSGAGASFSAAVDATSTALTTSLDAAVTGFAAAVDAAGTAFAAAVAGSSGASAGAGVAGALASANGNVFSGGNVIPFARGGVVDRATVVPMALMGEAGPEAIMPLRRGKGGSLGVAVASGNTQPTAPTIQLTQHFAVPPGTSTATQQQIASKAYSGAARAFQRNG